VARWLDKAERLCSAILAIESFSGIDPQAPLGGADGRKDVVAYRDGKKWIAAVYFPPIDKSFSQVKAKFKDDLVGVDANDADAFVFFTNQRLTLDEREELRNLSSPPVEIYSLERLRAVLDSPMGYGIRLEYLGIDMTAAEQLAFVRSYTHGVEGQLAALNEKVDQILERTVHAGSTQAVGRSSLLQPTPAIKFGFPVRDLSVSALALVHRAVMETEDERTRGRLRTTSVWISDGRDTRREFPAPEEVPPAVEEFVEWWREKYHALESADDIQHVATGLAELHHRFVSIHPFLDGNGRVARVLLDQAAAALRGAAVADRLVEDPDTYLLALRTADEGDLTPLARLIEGALAS
jgi:fido (protein-threonine AMPylation protein)